jgi:hypothetical protein
MEQLLRTGNLQSHWSTILSGGENDRLQRRRRLSRAKAHIDAGVMIDDPGDQSPLEKTRDSRQCPQAGPTLRVQHHPRVGLHIETMKRTCSSVFFRPLRVVN